MINIPAEALFDLLQTSEAEFNDYIIKIDGKVGYNDFIPIGERNYSNSYIYIKKSSFMELLLNRVFICNSFELKIEL